MAGNTRQAAIISIVQGINNLSDTRRLEFAAAVQDAYNNGEVGRGAYEFVNLILNTNEQKGASVCREI